MSKSKQKRLNIQRGLTMTIREEFEKAFLDYMKSDKNSNGDTYVTALWAAKWMAERCANLIDSYNAPDDLPSSGGNKIRQLAKELQ